MTVAAEIGAASESIGMLVSAGHIPKNADVAESLIRSWHNTIYFSEWLLPGVFKHPFSWQHEKIFELLDDETQPKVCVCAWRGCGKTTLAAAKIIKSALMRQRKCIMVVAASHDKAVEITENIKTEIMTNERIRSVFCPPGTSFKAKSYEDISPTFGRKGYFICDPVTGAPMCFIMPKGINQPFRGTNININGEWCRPDLIVVDDLEKDGEVNNPDLREDVRSMFEGSLVNCVPQARPETRGEWSDRWRPEYDKNPAWFPPWRILYQDTIKHHDANITHIMGAADWKSVKLPQIKFCQPGTVLPDGKVVKVQGYYSMVAEKLKDRDGKTFCFMSHGQAARFIKIAKERGRMAEAARERMCLATPPEMTTMNSSLFQYYDEAESNIADSVGVTRFVIADPARSTEPRSSYTSILSVGVDPIAQNIYIRKLKQERMEAAEIYSSMVDMCISQNARILFVEKQGLHSHLEYGLKTELSKRGLLSKIRVMYLSPQSTPRNGDYGHHKDSIKAARASQILPYYQNRNVMHERANIRGGPVEVHLLEWPVAKSWDTLDCLGYIPQCLNEMKLLFHARKMDISSAFNNTDGEYERCGEFFANEENWVGSA